MSPLRVYGEETHLPRPDPPIGFVSASAALTNHAAQLTAAGARALIADMRALKSTVASLRGW